MSRRFILEDHPDRLKIEYDLARGVPLRAIAIRYGVARSTACRWLKKLPVQLRCASLTGKLKSQEDVERLRLEESNGLLGGLAMQRARLLLAQDQALEISDHHTLAVLSNQIHKNLELTGRYLGEFAKYTVSTNVSVLVQPQYLELRSKIVQALRPFPEARKAVAEVLHQIEGTAAAAANAPPVAANNAQAPPMIEAHANA